MKGKKQENPYRKKLLANVKGKNNNDDPKQFSKKS